MDVQALPALAPLTLIRGGNVFAPRARGRADVLIGGGQILAIGTDLPSGHGMAVADASGLWVLPGFIDGHVHILGGGGEGGPATRNPELSLSQITAAGVTTFVGLLGFDCLTRSIESLLAKVRGLAAEGLSAYALTGGYTVPTPTLTGSVMRDIALVEQIVGVGEIAVSDHRSSNPTGNELAKVIGEARVGGLLGHKRGTAVLHIGNGDGGLAPLEALLASTAIPAEQLLPTHTNRNRDVFRETIKYAQAGGVVDLTAGIAPHLGFPDALKASAAARELLEAGIPIERITLSSDANGNMPVRDASGRVIRLDIQEVVHLYREVRDLVRDEGIPIERALQTVTTNPARVFGLASKGSLEPGQDADLVLVDPAFELRSVYARGRLLVDEGEPIVRGTFEK